MSGMTKTPLFSRISSAAAVVGPFAPSQMILALMWGAFLRRSEEHTSELQSRSDLVCRLLLEKKKQLHPSPPRQRGPAWFKVTSTGTATAHTDVRFVHSPSRSAARSFDRPTRTGPMPGLYVVL